MDGQSTRIISLNGDEFLFGDKLFVQVRKSKTTPTETGSLLEIGFWNITGDATIGDVATDVSRFHYFVAYRYFTLMGQTYFNPVFIKIGKGGAVLLGHHGEQRGNDITKIILHKPWLSA